VCALRRLEREHPRVGIERLEEEHRHADVAAAVDDEGVRALRTEVVLELDEDLSVQVGERRDREARHVEPVDPYLHQAVVVPNAAGGEPQLRLRGLASPAGRDRSVR